MLQLIYEKNIKSGEIKRKARWVVRQNGNSETDKFFELAPGDRKARENARVEAERYITETLKVAVPTNRLDRYTLTSEPVKSTVTKITEAVTSAPQKATEVVKSNLQKAGDFLKSARNISTAPTMARSSMHSVKK